MLELIMSTRESPKELEAHSFGKREDTGGGLEKLVFKQKVIFQDLPPQTPYCLQKATSCFQCLNASINSRRVFWR